MDSPRRDAARNRAHIVETARRRVAAGEGLALNAVARAADVGVGTVYRHFATVEELEEAVVAERFEELAAVLRAAGPGQLEQVLSAHFRLLAEDALFESVTARARPALDQTTKTRDALIADLAELMSRARAQGDLRPEVDAASALLLVCGLAHAVRSAGVPADSSPSQVLLRVMLDGLRPPAA